MVFSLRKLEPDDLPLLYAWENDDSAWAGSDTHNPLSRQDLRAYIAATTGDIYRDGQLRLMVVRGCEEGSSWCENSILCDIHSTKGECVGCIDLFDFDARNRKAAIGLYVSPHARGQGVGHAAVQRVLRYAFEFLHLRMVYAVVSAENEPSTRLFHSVGFIPTARLRCWTLEGDAVVWQYINPHRS